MAMAYYFLLPAAVLTMTCITPTATQNHFIDPGLTPFQQQQTDFGYMAPFPFQQLGQQTILGYTPIPFQGQSKQSDSGHISFPFQQLSQNIDPGYRSSPFQTDPRYMKIPEQHPPLLNDPRYSSFPDQQEPQEESFFDGFVSVVEILLGLLGVAYNLTSGDRIQIVLGIVDFYEEVMNA